VQNNRRFIDEFSDMEDPRLDRRKLYPLIEIIFLTICAVISGANHFTEVGIFGEANIDWLRKFLPFANGIPSHDAIGYFFSRLDPEQFKAKFVEWMRSVAKITRGEVVAIDGKTLRHSYDSGSNKTAMHMISAWASNASLVLGQLKVNEKSNEITAIPKLLEVLDLSRCIVTIDAMGCQKAIAKTIIEKNADYVLALKGNQGTLHENVELFFQDQIERNFTDGDVDTHKTVDVDHGRVEVREYWSVNSIDWLEEAKGWKGLRAIGCARLTRTIGEETSSYDRYYILSQPMNAQAFGNAVRSHWGIENKLHWSLDMTFREDESRIRKKSTPDNFGVIRHICINLLKQETTFKRGLQGKRYRASMDPKYREKLIVDAFF
jgi:predicted transposase YbfD/YdcC|tara:strand:- start:70 stop:1200 length:1131 start_codon:yes stop_codon:yes gene_type:complete